MVQQLMTAWKIRRWRWALLIAAASDALGFGVVLLPPLQWVLDAVTAAALLIALGFRWQLFAALAIEVVPAFELFPAWTLVVLALSATATRGSPDGKVDSGIPPNRGGDGSSPNESRQGIIAGDEPSPPLLLNPPGPDRQSNQAKLPPPLPQSNKPAAISQMHKPAP